MSTEQIGRDFAAPGNRALALATILAAQLMLQMDFLIVIVALPRIQADLGFTPAGLSWVPNAFALAFGGLLLLGGRLGDMFGQVKAFQAGLAVFVLASLLGGLIQAPSILILARVLQGVGAALAGPSVLALITVMARDEAERNRGLALFIAVSSVGASAGLILGGVLTDLASWRWSLLINVPVGAVVLVMIRYLVAETVTKPSRLDFGGAATATLGSVALVYGFINAADRGWTSFGTAPSFAVAAVMFVAFASIERRVSEPLLDLALLRSRPRMAGIVVMALIVGMHFSMLFLIVQYLQRVLGFGALAAGLAYLPLTATVFVVTHFIPKLIVHFGARLLLMAGSVLVAFSLACFGLVGDGSRYFPAIIIAMIIHAVGIGLVFAPGTVAIMEGVPGEQAGTASGLLQMDQQIGGALGIAVIAAVYSSASVPGEFVPGLWAAFNVGAVVSLVAGLIAWKGIPPKKVCPGLLVPG
ncbi:MFS transporter [Aurantimonas sp. 22II-16-19i]|uniref:MFS transporter n=1 Tax=Aurantimonas sp. 22II-16-19i TaxID=1317114 RepID=UPI0009F7FBD7|nr:MFS transporter [Aurantimonas sp. 22II-16-19i]ORE93289.1 major facilitator transporter [Aurantimonas sp. 22II-16-19i]